jgi:hypothetical protein
MICSCFIPYLIDENISYKNKYIDGINPFFFEVVPNKKILFLDLYTVDKLNCLLNIKNERSTFHRILFGLLEMHHFFMKNQSTQMCSYVNHWSFFEQKYNMLKIVLEKIFIYMISLFVMLHNNLQDDIKKFFIYEYIIKLNRKMVIYILDNYCL